MRLRLPLLALFLVPSLCLAEDASPYAPLPRKVSSFGACVCNDHVYVYGGHSGRPHSYSVATISNQFARIPLAGGKWEELPSGPAVQGTALVAHQGKLYRLGGMQPRNQRGELADNHSLASCASYDPATRKWQALPDLPEPRSSHDAVVLGDRIYIFGGWSMLGGDRKPNWLSKGLVLDLTQSPLRWKEIEQPFQRRALGVAALNGKIYVLGGLQARGGLTNGIDIYDPASGKWTTGPEMPGKGAGFSAAPAVVDNRLYISTNDGKLHVLDRAGKTWEPIGKQQVARHVNRMVPGARGTLLILGGNSSTGDAAIVEVISTSGKRVSSN